MYETGGAAGEKLFMGTLIILTGDGLYKEIIQEVKQNLDELRETHTKGIDIWCVYLQIPHHGGIHNTRVNDNSILPQAILSSGDPLNIIVFASGGEGEIQNLRRKEGP